MPTGLTAVKSSEKTAKISWNAVADATSYEVQYYSPSSSSWKTDSDYKMRTATSYSSTGLGLYDSYQFRVRAVNSAGSSDWSQVTYTKPSTSSVPTAPTGLSAVSASSDHNSAKISWKVVSGATSYQVQYWSPANSDWRTDTSYSSGTSYTSTGLSANSSWTFRVRAVNSAGSSDWSQVTYTKPSMSGDYTLDGYSVVRVERNMTVSVGSGSTLRFCNAPTSNNTRLGAISNNATVYVFGYTTQKYPNISGTYITWAKITYNGMEGWVNYAYLQ